jgi:hypothetical protein
VQRGCVQKPLGNAFFWGGGGAIETSPTPNGTSSQNWAMINAKGSLRVYRQRHPPAGREMGAPVFALSSGTPSMSFAAALPTSSRSFHSTWHYATGIGVRGAMSKNVSFCLSRLNGQMLGWHTDRTNEQESGFVARRPKSPFLFKQAQQANAWTAGRQAEHEQDVSSVRADPSSGLAASQCRQLPTTKT